ncbi:hypothetical protein SETIT_5G328600v2 [Setaria italica]|uniref:Phytocyanin domain-containing protein n=1 Tax=Setaria italica TaxID=4555 RepID=A0A368RBD2_SETIT|nr:lamin-like protein [Setaria italica]RCV27489.1 hypothetical protein SETIT_5G328600v2 [Setaria italica]
MPVSFTNSTFPFQPAATPLFRSASRPPEIMATPPRLLVVVLLLLATAPALSVAAKLVVGDRKRWAPNVNYTDWADRHEFYVGDWLDFEYEKDRYDVVQVNETAYARCDGSSPILSYSRGHNFPFQLNRTGRFYFICSRGYCWNGMKVSVLVQPAPLPPAMAPSSHASRARAAAGVWRWVGLAALLLLGSLPFRV